MGVSYLLGSLESFSVCSYSVYYGWEFSLQIAASAALLCFLPGRRSKGKAESVTPRLVFILLLLSLPLPLSVKLYSVHGTPVTVILGTTEELWQARQINSNLRPHSSKTAHVIKV